MSQKSRKRGSGAQPKRPEAGNAPESRGRFGPHVVAFALGAALAVGAMLGFAALRSGGLKEGPEEPVSADVPGSHYDLLAMSPDELAKVDFALMNLLCAKGLPGAEDLNIPATLAKLDEWAAKVKFETERHLYRVTDPRYAEHYNHSEARLRAEFIVQVLQEDCGVHYNEARISNPDFRNAQDIFIHGMIGSDNGGTCASMPVLYTAIGRRLGYPMRLVLAREHIFCRWDDGNERFNIEGATNGGIDYYPDQHYMKWPKPISEASVKSGEFLKSLPPAEELSTFLFDRGICCHKNGRLLEARVAFAEAARLRPQSRNTQNALRVVVAGQGGMMQPRRPMREPVLPPMVQQGNPPDPTPKIPTPGRPPGP